MKTGILLINLGTPDSPGVKDVRKYLREFLSDPYVVDTHPIIRWLLLNFIILPLRPKRSAHAYQSIWTTEGSPLLINSKALAEGAQALLGQDYCIALGMRYGKPSIATAIEHLKGCERLIILPLFPQYSSAATQTAIEKAQSVAKHNWADDKIKIIREFYCLPSFIDKTVKIIRASLGMHPVEKILFSYHGLPQRQVRKICHANNICDMHRACSDITTMNRDCYRAQCFATSKALATALNLDADQYMTTFQSRLGRIPWIEPYTDRTLERLSIDGVKRIAIVCPSFIVDCLETLEEIGIRARRQWQALGGEHLSLIPCINQDADWIRDVIKATV